MPCDRCLMSSKLYFAEDDNGINDVLHKKSRHSIRSSKKSIKDLVTATMMKIQRLQPEMKRNNTHGQPFELNYIGAQLFTLLLSLPKIIVVIEERRITTF